MIRTVLMIFWHSFFVFYYVYVGRKMEIAIEQHGTNHLFQDIFMFAKYTLGRKLVCTLLRLAEKLTVNCLKAAIRQKEYGLEVQTQGCLSCPADPGCVHCVTFMSDCRLLRPCCQCSHSAASAFCQPSTSCSTSLPAQHLQPLCLFSCRSHSLELSPEFHSGSNHQCRLFQTSI